LETDGYAPEEEDQGEERGRNVETELGETTMPEEAGYKGLARLEVIRKLNARREWINYGLYKLLLDKDMYVLAYERMKSKPGNMTPGTDGDTLDGFSMAQIEELIEEMSNQSYQCKPVRTAYIPKSNGKLRKLGIPSTRDKLVQEVVTLILEAVYDSPEGPYFLECSYGFRSSKSCHGALREVQRKWSGVSWFLEGDIKSCFDDISHEILVKLKAGYQDLDRTRHDSLAGTPQGGIVSPILANIYSHELDVHVQQLQGELEKGKARRKNPKYHAISMQRVRMAQNGKADTEEYRTLGQHMRSLPSLDTHDPEFVRIKYVRYADDWLIGVTGSKELAEEIKERIRTFLIQNLALTLSEEKTKVTNAKLEEAEFLGYRIRKGRGQDQKVKTSTNGSGKSFKRRSTGDVDQIVNLYSSVNRGIQNYYRPTDNFPELWRVQYILKYSLAKTLALKLKKPVTSIMKQRDVGVTVKRKDKLLKIVFYRNADWTVKRDAFTDEPEIDIVRMHVRLRTRSKLGYPCCICGASENVEMHHVRHVRKMDGKKNQGFSRVMGILNRKQVPVCSTCHGKIHRGEYDGLRLKDLAYDPRKPLAS
jgi:group II intron reverse transcriptase/maturase